MGCIFFLIKKIEYIGFFTCVFFYVKKFKCESKTDIDQDIDLKQNKLKKKVINNNKKQNLKNW
jgi:hypothetical protein